MRIVASVVLALGCVGLFNGTAAAQRYIVLPRKGEEPRKPVAPAEPVVKNRTTVSVEILTGRLGGGVAAQRWATIFRDIGYQGRIRQLQATDKLGVFETTRGRLRDVRVVGRLEADGSIRFADRRVRQTDAGKLKEWLVELETFGQQGEPTGQPLWGLNRAQFERVELGLSGKVAAAAIGQPVRTTLGRLGTPATLPIRVSEDARPVLGQVPRDEAIGAEIADLSVGTALALLLRKRDLGFRPTRTPDGTLELVVVPLARTADVWPVGWDFEGSRQKAMPKMFSFVPVRLEDSKLTDVLAVIADRTEVPIHIDRHGIGNAGIAVDTLRTSYPAKKTSWSILLRNILGPHKLIREFRTDEAGNVFCWVTVFQTRPVGE